MHRDLLLDCLPFLIAMAIGVGVLRLLWWLSGAKWEPAVVRRLHGDQQGSVQSLSFVLTVPAFIMVMMFVVQLTQITIARLVVEYAAYAAVRSAIVWIPTGVLLEPPNYIGIRSYVDSLPGDDGGVDVHRIAMVGEKADIIHMAAAQACLPICPSRPLPGSPSAATDQVDALWAGYQATTPTADDSPGRRRVLQNKLTYALRRTRVEMDVHHPYREPPLVSYFWPYVNNFGDNEIGWRDALVVTVSHDYALLPGPGRLLATAVERRDRVAERIVWREGTYTYTLSATMTMTNEGQTPVVRIRQWQYHW